MQQGTASTGPDPSPDAPAATTSGSAKLFLGGLSWGTDEDKLRTYFSKFGEVDDVVVMRDRATMTPRGFGFITFKDQESAVLACKEAHNIDGRTIDAKPSVPQSESNRPRSKKIFVGGLSPDLTEDQFREYFSKYGEVVDATIMVDHNNNRSRGFGFVTFETEDSVQEIFKMGTMHMLAGKKVEVKSATPKGSGPLMMQQRGGPGNMGAYGGRGGAMVGMGRGFEPYPGQRSGGGYMGGMAGNFGGFQPGPQQYGMYGMYNMQYAGSGYPPGAMMMMGAPYSAGSQPGGTQPGGFNQGFAQGFVMQQPSQGQQQPGQHQGLDGRQFGAGGYGGRKHQHGPGLAGGPQQ